MKLAPKLVEGGERFSRSERHRARRGVLRISRGAVRRGLHVASGVCSGRVWMRQNAGPYLLLNHLHRVRRSPREDGPRRAEWRVFGGRGFTSVALRWKPRGLRDAFLREL